MKKKSEANEPEVVVEKYPEPQAVIMLPTRELATQIRDQALKLCADSNVQVRVTYGGIGYRGVGFYFSIRYFNFSLIAHC